MCGNTFSESELSIDGRNKLEQSDIDCGSINGFKNKLELLEVIQKTRIGLFMD